MPFAEVNGLKLYYDIQGEGYPLFLLHGYGATSEIWIAQAEPLSKHFKVIRYDSRSSGKSDHPKEPFTLDDLVEDFKGIMDFLKIDKANVIGQSMGGWVTQNFVLKYPNRVNKIVLLGTNHKGDGIDIFKNTLLDLYELSKTDKEQAYWKYAKLVHHRKFIKEMQADVKKKFYGLWSAEDLMKEFHDNKLTPSDYENLSQAVSTHNVLNRLTEIRIPVLLICASNDKLSPKLVMDEMNEKLPKSTLELVDNTAHHVFLEEAPKVNELIINFLKN
ncbi:MAG: alpha/beta hydrolase [Candidatus Lokiarchaeota archaeon]|nr:alpha/beta hydrolase [Candidatus Lokiarchaeota archaeon]